MSGNKRRPSGDERDSSGDERDSSGLKRRSSGDERHRSGDKWRLSGSKRRASGDEWRASGDGWQSVGATAGVALAGTVLHFDFSIPEGPQGVPGEVTQAQLSNDLVNCQNAAVLTTLPQTSANSNGVGTMGASANGSYDQSQMQDVMNKIDELINALRR